MQQRIRNRQETVNRRFKNWGILKQVYRQVDRISDHGDVFRAICVLTQISINEGEKLFACGYHDPPYNNNNPTNNGNEADFDDL